MRNKALLAMVGCVIVVLALFDVDIDPQFALPQQVEQADAEQEAAYLACVDEQDRIIHAETFAAIDNPDVQREVLSTRREQAARACREMFPERSVTVEEPFRFKLVDLEFRY